MWILFFIFFSIKVHADSSAITVKETDVRKEALDNAESYGLLPKDTNIRLKGPTDNDYTLIEVELEDGKIEGWILQSALDKKRPPGTEKPKALPKLKKRAKVIVPIEEAILIRRERLFFYGASLGVNYGVLSGPQVDYLGVGFGLHGNLGYYLDPALALRIDGGYSRVAGTDARDIGIYFGFLDFSTALSYFLDPFELFAGLKYALGIGLSDLPSSIKLDRASDLSSLYLIAGAGYEFVYDNVTSFGARAQYDFSLSGSPMGFQILWLRAYIQFRG